MKNYKDSDYALNKYSEGIVYKFVDRIVEITREDYLRENPDKTEADFLELKAISDEIYHEQANEENRTKRFDISLYMLNETELISVPAIDIELMEQEEKKEGEKVLKAAKKLLSGKMLTAVQKRRFLLYFFQGCSTREIAKKEGVCQRAVWDSLNMSMKKLKKCYEE